MLRSHTLLKLASCPPTVPIFSRNNTFISLSNEQPDCWDTKIISPLNMRLIRIRDTWLRTCIYIQLYIDIWVGHFIDAGNAPDQMDYSFFFHPWMSSSWLNTTEFRLIRIETRRCYWSGSFFSLLLQVTDDHNGGGQFRSHTNVGSAQVA